jgi:hypothetical protein
MEAKKRRERKSKPEKQVENKRGEEKYCNRCRWYDKSKEREFHRKIGKKDEKGIRAEIIEVRSICTNEETTAFHHLVMAECLRRQCPQWEGSQ